MEAYKALQKSLRLRPAAGDDEDAPPAPYGDGPDSVDFLHSNQAPLLRSAVQFAMTEIALAESVPCVSRVAGKNYYAFRQQVGATSHLSRPVNEALFSSDMAPVVALFDVLEAGYTTEQLSVELQGWDRGLLQRTLYSMAMSFCCAIDIQKTGDKKTPGTFFEYFVAYIFSRVLRVNPVRRVEIRTRDTQILLPTDFIFDPGAGRRKFHVPVKTSTRERVIQVWAHQRVIDGTLGQGRYLGTPVIMTETKLNKRNLEVVEICLPEQWQVYQGHIAQLNRIYYLDVPQPYVALNNVVPPICIRPLSDFFFESSALA